MGKIAVAIGHHLQRIDPINSLEAVAIHARHPVLFTARIPRRRQQMPLGNAASLKPAESDLTDKGIVSEHQARAEPPCIPPSENAAILQPVDGMTIGVRPLVVDPVDTSDAEILVQFDDPVRRPETALRHDSDPAVRIEIVIDFAHHTEKPLIACGDRGIADAIVSGDVERKDFRPRGSRKSEPRRSQFGVQSYYIALTMFSVIFLASPSSIIVLSR